MAEKKINGRTFKVQRMLATKALVLQGRLLKALGPAVAKFKTVLQGQGEEASADAKAQANTAALTALGEILTTLDPREYASLVTEIVQVAQIQRADGTYSSADLDGDFSENPEDIIPVVWFVLAEQFGSFFKGLPGSGNLGNLLKG